MKRHLFFFLMLLFHCAEVLIAAGWSTSWLSPETQSLQIKNQMSQVLQPFIFGGRRSQGRQDDLSWRLVVNDFFFPPVISTKFSNRGGSTGSVRSFASDAGDDLEGTQVLPLNVSSWCS